MELRAEADVVATVGRLGAGLHAQSIDATTTGVMLIEYRSGSTAASEA